MEPTTQDDLLAAEEPAMKHLHDTYHGTLEEIAAFIDVPLPEWRHNCHVVSLAFVRSGLVTGRVARGACKGVGAQHSWVVVGGPESPASPSSTPGLPDCYAFDARIIDPTLWSYRKDTDPFIWEGTARDGLHTPHGFGSIWRWGRPVPGDGTPIELPREGLSRKACDFLDLLGPLDRQGWHVLLSGAPVCGWPAAEIVSRACADPRLRAYVPIDRVGMLTDLNPDGLYLRREAA